MTTTAGTPRAPRVRAIAEQHLDLRGPLLPILHEVVAEFGHIDRSDVETIADVLNLSVAEVHGVVSFYTDFRTEPPAAHHVALCRGEACQAVGAQALFEEVTAQHRDSSTVEVHEVFCLGNCALGPSGTIDGRLRGRLNAESVSTAVAR